MSGAAAAFFNGAVTDAEIVAVKNIGASVRCEQTILHNAAPGFEALAKVPAFRRLTPRVNRNEPCHCGSGDKFKKCHGRPE